MSQGLLVLVGVNTAPGQEPLAYAASDVDELRKLVPAELSGDPLLDPTEQQARDFLDELYEQASGGPLLLVWSGHGVVSAAGELRLLAANSRPRPGAGLSVSDVAQLAVGSGASQLLLVFDTCYSGAGASVAGVAKRALEALPPDADHVWVGVLASAQEQSKAQDGLFGRQLRRLLTDGPKDADLRRRWSVHSRMLRGDDLCDALLKEWDDNDRQRPDFSANGSAWWLLPNPLYRPDAPEQVVEHLLRAARGGAEADEQSWFTGRTGEVDQIVDWVTGRRAGMFVVTGSPGTGKSAVLGRVVSAANPTERQRLLADGPLGHADPGESAVTANVHARGLTADRIAELLDAQLTRAGHLPRHEAGERNAAELLGALQRAHATVTATGAADQRPPVLIIDGLDEAREQAFPIGSDLLVKLAGLTTVIVATRQLPPPPGSQTSLLAVLAANETLDLNDERWQASGREALREYVIRRLTGVDERMDPALVAALLAGEEEAAPATDRW